MKLRIRGSSIRLRLTRSEVERFAAGGEVEEVLDIGDGSETFRYALVRSQETVNLTASFRDGTLRVLVPAGAAEHWAGTDMVSIENGPDSTVRLLVEKDFACLSPRPGEDETDMFSNPAAKACGPEAR